MPATDCVNIAVGKSAWQSSLSKYSVGNDAERALYADETLDYAFHTDREMNPWWLLDLGESFLVERIVLGNRRRTCQENARTLAVEVSLDRKSWLTLHAGMLYWYADLCLELASNIPFRYLRLSLREKQYFHLSKVEVWARSSAILPIKDKVILAARTDGLGERLNALLNGLMLAKIFDIPFRFSWSDRFLGDPMHAIDPVCDFFDKKFVDEYFSPESLPGKRWEVGGKNIALAELRNSIVKADVILAPRLGLDEIFGAKFHMPEYFGFSTLFDELPFAREVESAISLARSISLPEGAVGFHLRSGDIFYGRYRKWVNYTYKGVTLPLAKMVIESLVSEGRKVYLFGQDDEAIDYLCREYGTIDIRCSIGEQLEGMGRTQRAMFDLVMLSRFKTILAGSSGFAKQASWIGGGELVMPFHMFDIERQLNSIEGDLLVNADVYNPLQTAFAYWYAYYRGRGLKRYDQDNRFLALAEFYDQDNELYPLVRAASGFFAQDYKGGEQTLSVFFKRWQSAGKDISSIFNVFVARTNGVYNLREFHPGYKQAAELGKPFSCCLYAYFCGHSGDDKRQKEILGKVDFSLPGLQALEAMLKGLNGV